VETADSQLTYAFSVSNDSLLYTYTETTGILELFAVSGFSGNVTLTIQVNDPENAAVSSELSVTVNPVVGIAEITGAGIPQEFALRQNYPSPFNPNTTIKFQLPHTEDVKLAVYNILGQKVRILLNEKMNAGYYQVSWDGLSEHGRQMASGVYIYRLEAGSFVEVKKMTLMK
jgi:methionine-rich copper-binding protein CopC